MNDEFITWCFSIQGTLQNMVTAQHKKYLRIWPVINGFAGKVYPTEKIIIYFLKDEIRQIPAIGKSRIEEIEDWKDINSFGQLNTGNFPQIYQLLLSRLNVRKQDVLVVLPNKGNLEQYKELKDYFLDFSQEEQAIWHIQMEENLKRQCDYMDIPSSGVEEKGRDSVEKPSIWAHPLMNGVVYPLIVVFLLWIFRTPIITWYQSAQIESTRYNVALVIYPEILGDVKKLDVCIKEFEAGKKCNFDKIKFNQEAYKKHYKEGLFGGDNLDKQLANFYNGINSIDVLFKKPDLQLIKSQGDNVLQVLADRYNLQDYTTVREPGDYEVSRAVSQDTLYVPVAASSAIIGITNKLNR